MNDIKILKLGIRFAFKGEPIIWLWWWKRRHQEYKYLALIYEGWIKYRSLREIDEVLKERE